ncbi:hypothetical protein IFM53868_09867 [Aspergillus udagawae]|uniref:Uncharacterized protein n=1 Tax=Aspergillus udagawae TaxID=91492 RepID=A0ABQ1BCM5_9EURO|nr:hypothetical protein IFM53868_09867 [Aspergillus udagawae]
MAREKRLCMLQGGYRRLAIAQALLEHGADPNALDDDGLAPVNLAVGNGEMVRLLAQHEADLRLGAKPILFGAIDQQDVKTVQFLLESGFDCLKHFKEPVPPSAAENNSDGEDRWAGRKAERLRKEQEEEARRALQCHPLHSACHAQFNYVTERHKAVAIVELLLSEGASHFLPCEGDTSIIHDVIYQGGILELLLSLPQFDLEYRDPQGRTLLLAACEPEKDNKWLNKRFEHFQPYRKPCIRRQQVIRQLVRYGG